MRNNNIDETGSHISIAVNPYGDGRLSDVQIKEILEKCLDIQALSDIGIKKPAEYKKKQKRYFDISKELYENYGIKIGGFPLKNPLKLTTEIHMIMNKAGLNQTQIEKLFKEIELAIPRSDVRSNQLNYFERLISTWNESTIEELSNQIDEREELNKEDMLLREQIEQDDEDMKLAEEKHRLKFSRVLL